MQFARSMQARQRGMSMIGFLFVAIVLVMLAIVGMKLVPAYIEFYSVKKIINTMGQESETKTKSNKDIRMDYAQRASINYVTVVKPEDLLISRRDGETVISAEYEFRTQLFGNLALIADFSASSDPNASSSKIE